MYQTANNKFMNNNLLSQQSNIEEPGYFNMAQKEEQNRVSNFYEKSKRPISTNQIPYGMNQNIFNKSTQPTNNFIEEMEKQDMNEGFQSFGDGNGNGQVYSELTGSYMTNKDFKHNNMVPFSKNKPKIQKHFVIKIY